MAAAAATIINGNLARVAVVKLLVKHRPIVPYFASESD